MIRTHQVAEHNQEMIEFETCLGMAQVCELTSQVPWILNGWKQSRAQPLVSQRDVKSFESSR